MGRVLHRISSALSSSALRSSPGVIACVDHLIRKKHWTLDAIRWTLVMLEM
jgi:hypothetical protein